MNIDGLLSWIEVGYLTLQLTNSTNCTFKNLFDEDTLLWVYVLIVAFFKFPVNIDVLDIKHSQILEHFIFRPVH